MYVLMTMIIMINSQQLIKQILQYDVGLWYNHKKVFSFTKRDCCFVLGNSIWQHEKFVISKSAD